jgi:hypothetical protein
MQQCSMSDDWWDGAPAIRLRDFVIDPEAPVPSDDPLVPVCDGVVLRSERQPSSDATGAVTQAVVAPGRVRLRRGPRSADPGEQSERFVPMPPEHDMIVGGPRRRPGRRGLVAAALGRITDPAGQRASRQRAV